MKRVWQLSEAKNKLSEVLDEANRHGPEVAMVLSSAAYRKITATQKTLSTFFRESPLVGMDLDVRRDTSDMQEDTAS
jgi:antitoxin Phd